MKKKVKVTITAEDELGREESITLMLDVSTAKRLEKAAILTFKNRDDEDYLREELNHLMDNYRYYEQGGLSKSQYRRLDDFFYLIYHKFYNYSLQIEFE